MERKTKILIIILIIFGLFSISAKYYKFITTQDYYVSAELSCDTETESCFVWDCDLTDEECDQTPYKYIWKYAGNTSFCNPTLTECPELTCGPNEEYCEIIYCSEETLGEEEYCYNENTN